MGTVPPRLDEARAGQPFFWLNLKSNPAQLEHQSWDYCDMSGRWVDGLLLGRRMSGSTAYAGAEDTVRRFLLSRATTQDGLFYNAEEPAFGSRAGADIFCQRSVLFGLLSWWMDTGDQRVEGYLDRLVRGLHAAASWDGEVACFPGTLWNAGRLLDAPDSMAALDPKVAPVIGSPGYRSCLLNGLVMYNQLSGNTMALRLAHGIARYYVERSRAVDTDGSYVGHTHSGGVLPTTCGVLRLGLALGDAHLVHWEAGL
jgi:hypothetical protein